MRRWLVLSGLGLVAAALTFGLTTSCASMGKKPYGEHRERLTKSPEWHDDMFQNPEAMWGDMLSAMKRGLFAKGDEASPLTPVPHIATDPSVLANLPASGLRVTWFGHSSILVEIDGVRFLTDPIWSERASPVAWGGPKRWFDPTIALEALPPIDAVIISHDHYDHLDRATVVALADTKTIFIVPLGIGSHLVYWGIPQERIFELDWWQAKSVGSVTVNAVPARHASGRVNPRSGQTLWAGYALVGNEHRVYYSGDTGFQAAFDTIGEKLGPFDVTLIESGQYDLAWPDWHLGPEQAVEAHRHVHGRVMIPVHWALFSLAPHNWTEPVERVLAAAECHGVDVQTPRPGEPTEPTTGGAHWHWWPSIKWQTGAEAPVVATHHGEEADRFTLPPCER